jgi:sulfane dehydrogenase subunit SoxC
MSYSKKPESSKAYLAELANKVPSSSRRDFLKKGVKFSTGLAAATVAGEAISDNLPPNIPSWSKSLGTGVVSTPYGIPSKFEKTLSDALSLG